MTRIIACISGKGGVGKTTVVSNLGVALAKFGRNVIVVDANLTTPNLGLHLGVPLYPTTLHDVLKGTAAIKDAIYYHDSGLKIIPAGLSLRDLRGVDSRDLPNVLLDLLGTSDIVLLDAAAGLGKETLSAIEAADETMLVANPELTSVADALKASKLAQQL
ncbi:MAG: AAA family ATPase, partial [Candidatus Aenigmarchaeota archaeon]|nr:AAA family ATPase [Candidatus Aenigmarchaeota archaeon]MDI6722801.1 AAA family ATPase [Candidatus Aenigmarchaeota archaeon]